MAAESTVNGWLAEYTTSLVWREFSSDERNISDPHINLVEAIINQPNNGKKSFYHVKFLVLMCKLVKGESYDVQYGTETNDVTVLEKCISIYDSCINWLVRETSDKYRHDVAFYRSLMKAQAVLVCCQLNDFTVANKVYDRLYQNCKSKEDKEWSSKLRQVLKSKKCGHPVIAQNPYADFLDKMVSFFGEHFPKQDKPFLIKIAEAADVNICQKRHSLPNQMSCKSLLAYGPYSKDLINRQILQYREKAINQLISDVNSCNNRVLRNEEATVESTTSSSASSSASSTSSTSSSVSRTKPSSTVEGNNVPDSPSKRTQNQNKNNSQIASTSKSPSKSPMKSPGYRPNINRENRHQPVETQVQPSGYSFNGTTDDDDDEIPPKVPRKTLNFVAVPRPSLAPPANGVYGSEKSLTSHKKRFWTDDETLRFYRALQKHGVGKWAIIKSEMGTDRTSVNIKDRWRNMVKNGTMDDYISNYGPYHE